MSARGKIKVVVDKDGDVIDVRDGNWAPLDFLVVDAAEDDDAEPLTEEAAQCIDPDCPDAATMPYHDHDPRFAEPTMQRFEGIDYPQIVALQTKGKVVAVIDRACVFDTRTALSIGVDLQTLLVSQPDTDEQAEEIASALARSGAVDAAFLS